MDIEQKQCLLKYLKYYEGKVDGIWGAKSEEATEDFQRAEGIKDDGVFGNDTTNAIIDAVANGRFKTTATKTETTSSFWDEIKYFKKSEFACKCGKCGGYPVEPQEKLVKAEDKVRKHFGVPVHNSSGVRCKNHNANVGGVANSRHLFGKAVDFRVTGKTANQVLSYVNTLPEIRYAYDIDGTYVHMDIE